MGTFSDVSAAITAGTTEGTGTINVPSGARIIKYGAVNLTGTGVLYKFRFEFPGMTRPQSYLIPTQNALEGTEVGGGQSEGKMYDCDIAIPAGVSQITIGLTAGTAAQTCHAALVWVK